MTATTYPEYKIGDKVYFKMKRCACVGGGYTEQFGTIVGILTPPKGRWYQIDYGTGLATVQQDWVLNLI